jgi:hypothetical protein
MSYGHGVGRRAAAVALWLVLGSVVASAEPLPRIVNGLDTFDFPTTGALLSGRGVAITADNAAFICSGTLVGCHTFLTAAHCVSGDLDPSHYWIYLQNAGIVAVSSVAPNPAYTGTLSGNDVAVVTLATDVTGIAPTPINATHDLVALGVGLFGTIVGFGETAVTALDFGIKRYGLVQTANCVPTLTGGEGNDKLVCWDFAIPVGPPGQDSDTCNGDSGGPLFLDFGGSTEVAGVTSTGSSPFCRPLDHSWDASVYYNAAWIESALAADSTATCGGIGPVGAASAFVVGNAGTLSPAHPSDTFTVDLGPSPGLVRFALNGQWNATFDPNLYVKAGPGASLSSYDCKADGLSPFGACEIPLPAPGAWSVFVADATGAGRYQIATTVFVASTSTSTTTTSTTTSTTTTTVPPCAAITDATLVVTRVAPPPGDDGLTFRGRFHAVPPVGLVLDPVGHGIDVRLLDGTSPVLDAHVPAGAYDHATRVGWTVNRKTTAWTFVGPPAGAAGGIVKVVLTDQGAKAPGTVAFVVVGKRGSYAVSPGVVAGLAFPASGACFEARFPASPPATPSCVLAKTALRCR